MRDLDGELARWRASFARELPADRGEVLDELEGHVRDAIRDGVARGEPWQAALERAIHRLGTVQELAREFRRVPAPILPWWPARVVACLVAAALLASLAVLVPRFFSGDLSLLLALHVALVSLGYLACAGVGTLAALYLGWRLVQDPLPGEKRGLRRALIRLSALAATATAAGIGLGVLCPLEKHGWCFGLSTQEVGGLAILGWTVVVLTCLRRTAPTVRPERRMLLGLAANVVLLLGWSGARLIDEPEVGAGTSLLVWLLLAHLALAATTWAPANCLRLARSSS